jgi:hypothetical protein
MNRNRSVGISRVPQNNDQLGYPNTRVSIKKHDFSSPFDELFRGFGLGSLGSGGMMGTDLLLGEFNSISNKFNDIQSNMISR